MRTSFPWLSKFIPGFVFVGALTGCAVGPPPYEDYNLARAAMKAAQEAESARYSSGIYNRAEQSFRQAEREYKDSEFKGAREHFRTATALAERAENMSRLKKFQTGDTPP